MNTKELILVGQYMDLVYHYKTAFTRAVELLQPFLELQHFDEKPTDTDECDHLIAEIDLWNIQQFINKNWDTKEGA